MSRAQVAQLRRFEGQRVSVALRDGERIDDCQLISVGRYERGRVWLFANGSDTFVALDCIVDVWEA